jgi:hypothetical protein
MIDCTSYFELEQAEYAAKGITLSVEAWLVKLMVRCGGGGGSESHGAVTAHAAAGEGAAALPSTLTGACY